MSAQVHFLSTSDSSLLLNACMCVCLPHLELLQVRSLHADHRGQQLVLKPVPGHGEVDQGALGLQLGLVVRAGQLGVQDEAETGVVLALLVSDLYVPV